MVGKSIFFIIVLYINAICAFAQPAPPLVLEDAQNTFSPANKAEFLEDPSRQLTLEEVSSPSWSNQFVTHDKPNLSFGRSRSAFWIRFQVVDESQQKWYLLLDAMLEDELDLFIFPVGQLAQAGKIMTGDYATALKNHRRHAWSLNLPKGKVLQVYMRVTNGDSVVVVPIGFLNADTMLSRSNGEYRLNSAIYIGMITLGLYQLFMFFILREKNYLFLAANILAMAWVIHRTNPAFDGLNFLRGTSTYFFSTPILLAVLTTAAFARTMLDTQKNVPWVDFIFKLFIWIPLGMIFVVGLLPAGPMYALMLGLCILIFTQFSGFYVAYFKNGGIIAKYFAWIYLIPFLLHLPNLVMLLFKVELWQAQRDLIPAFGTLLFMLFLALLQAKRTGLLRGEMERATAINAAKDEFIAVMNHELRTPMNAVVGLSDLLKLEKLTETQQRYVNRLSNASQHMMQLINNILDYSKAGQSNVGLKNKPFRLDIALQSVYNLLVDQANQKGLVLLFDNQTEKGLVVTGDRSKLAQILINLLNNSIKYTPDGQASLHVSQRPGNKANTVRLYFSVRDTGPGIPADQHENLFDPFTQLNTKASTSRHEGVGLGLPISKKLVKHMGGDLQVNSLPGAGSEFFFELEMPISSTADIDITHLHDSLEFTQLRLPPCTRILLVDDSEANRFVGAEMLQNMGGEVYQASSGKHAILQLQQHAYDLVLLDINMPDMDGLEVTRWIRKHSNNRQLPVVALTAHSSAEMEQQCRAAGMNDFISKPFEYKELHSVINHQLSIVNYQLINATL